MYKKLLLVAAMGLSASASASEWSHGIGTGFFGLNVEGDIGLNTSQGPSLSKVDLSSSDVSDLMESAFGFAGFAKKGPWTINYALGHLELEDSVKGEVTTIGTSYKATLGFTSDSIDVNVGYQFNKNWTVYGGVRNTNHEIKFEFDGEVADSKSKLENDWTDAYVGVQFSYPLSRTAAWTTKVDIGGGGSEGSATFNTGIGWKFSKNWLANVYVKHYQVEFEEGKAGDSDWYLYDSEEFGAGLGIMYTW